MRIRVRFKLSEGNSQLADALRHQLSREEGIELSLDDIVHRLFVNWMHNNLKGDGSNEGEINNQSIPDSNDVQAAIPSDALQQSEAGSTRSE